MTDCDVIIIGAGLSGSMLALAILRFAPELRVVLIDENDARSSKFQPPGFDARSIALSAGSCKLLEELDLLHKIIQVSEPIKSIKISDQNNLGGLTLTPKSEAYGIVTQLQDIGIVLETALAKFTTKQLSRRYKTNVTSIIKYESKITCFLSDGQHLTSKLCVAADGGNSQTRELLSIKSQTQDYKCSAIIANIKMKSDHECVAFERFTESGPIALLPLKEQCYSLVWSVDNKQVDSLMSLNESDFLNEIQSQFGFKAGIFKQVGKRDVYPLKLLSVNNPITHRGVCIGNAAHSLHPVMGQGFNLGFRDIYVLAKVIGNLELKSSLGDFAMLNYYWSCREKDHFKTINMTDSIVRIFSNTSPLFKLGRTLGLASMSCASFLSKPIIKQAKGSIDLFPVYKE